MYCEKKSNQLAEYSELCGIACSIGDAMIAITNRGIGKEIDDLPQLQTILNYYNQRIARLDCAICEIDD